MSSRPPESHLTLSLHSKRTITCWKTAVPGTQTLRWRVTHPSPGHRPFVVRSGTEPPWVVSSDSSPPPYCVFTLPYHLSLLPHAQTSQFSSLLLWLCRRLRVSLWRLRVSPNLSCSLPHFPALSPALPPVSLSFESHPGSFTLPLPPPAFPLSR